MHSLGKRIIDGERKYASFLIIFQKILDNDDNVIYLDNWYLTDNALEGKSVYLSQN